MPTISNMPRDYFAIGSVMGAQFSIADDSGKLTLWKTTLSIADAMLEAHPRNFNRNDFYFLVFGNRNHFAVRDEITERQMLSACAMCGGGKGQGTSCDNCDPEGNPHD